MSAGMTFPSRGAVLFNGQAVRGYNTRVGFVTQDSNLFPWLTLIENVGFPLRLRGIPAGQREQQAKELIDLVGLTGFERHFPSQLSGGMQKRASIARTLVYDPTCILMDEPFGPLDAQTRLVMQDELLRIWERDRKTILFVTHDLVEAVALSDIVVLLTRRPGRMKAVFEIPLARPRNVFDIHKDQAFADAYNEIWNVFKTEIVR
jgi:NitT/TauT family transport system ATP-binding protein